MKKPYNRIKNGGGKFELTKTERKKRKPIFAGIRNNRAFRYGICALVLTDEIELCEGSISADIFKHHSASLDLSEWIVNGNVCHC